MTRDDGRARLRENDRLHSRQRRPNVHLTRRDLAGTIVAALVVLVYAASVREWWFLGGNRWAAVTMLAVGFAGCVLGARIVGDDVSSGPIVVLSAIGLGALALAIIALVTGAEWALLGLMLAIVALWAGTTLRHATGAPRPVPS
jgi:hypothetical protein